MVKVAKKGSQQVTAIIRSKVRPECIDAFKSATQSTMKVCRTFSGYLGTRLIEPEDPGADRVIILSFDNYENFSRWEHSVERDSCLEVIAELVEGEVAREQISGLNYWMPPTRQWPPSWRMVVVAYLAIFPLSFYIPAEIKSLLPEHTLLGAVLSTALVTIMMSYITLPLMVRIFKRWLQ